MAPGSDLRTPQRQERFEGYDEDILVQTALSADNTSPQSFEARVSPGNSSPDSTIRRRRRLLPHETEFLARVFEQFPRPTAAMREALATKLGMSSRCIQIWFQNRRAKVKRDLMDSGQAMLLFGRLQQVDAFLQPESPLTTKSNEPRLKDVSSARGTTSSELDALDIFNCPGTSNFPSPDEVSELLDLYNLPPPCSSFPQDWTVDDTLFGPYDQTGNRSRM